MATVKEVLKIVQDCYNDLDEIQADLKSNMQDSYDRLSKVLRKLEDIPETEKDIDDTEFEEDK